MRALLLAALVALTGACTAQAPTAPTDPVATVSTSASTVVITAQVLEYQTGRPIAQATVYRDDESVGRTDEAGTVTTEAELGRELTMYATADGYRQSLTVAGVPYSAERWTFYLEPANAR